jgi:glycosyltransferase involved in cell wall biosynthesis
VVGVVQRMNVDDGVRVLEMADVFPARVRNGGLSPLDTVGRLLWIATSAYDVIHTFDHRPAVSLPGLAGRRRGALLVSDWADLWGSEGIAAERRGLGGRLLGALDGAWEARFRRHVDGVTAISLGLDRRVESMGLPASRRLLLPPGADSDRIHPLSSAECRQRYGLPIESRVVGFSGIAPYDVELTAQIVEILLERDRGLHVVTTGAEHRPIQEAAERAGSPDRLHVLGHVPYEALERAMACADVLLLPYTSRPVNRERFPNKLGDYLAAGRPIVTHATGDLGAWVAREDAGVLAAEDAEGTADEVLRLLGNAKRREELGRRARQLAEGPMSWRVRGEQVEAFYFRLLEGRPQAA